MAIADTGAQTCTAGTDLLSQLNCKTELFVKTRHRLRAVDDNNMARSLSRQSRDGAKIWPGSERVKSISRMSDK